MVTQDEKILHLRALFAENGQNVGSNVRFGQFSVIFSIKMVIKI